MFIIDFEVFKYDWLCVAFDPVSKHDTVIANDVDKLRTFYDNNCRQLFLGYNIRGYDQWIFRQCLAGHDPKPLNDHIIAGENGAAYYNGPNYPLYFYDVKTSFKGLKTLEAFMGHDIRETTVPFDLPRKLTQDELEQVIKYCKHDVHETYAVFCLDNDEFTSHLEICKAFSLGRAAMGKTKSQLAALALKANRQYFDDMLNYSIPSTLDVKRYTEVIDFFQDKSNYDKKLQLDVAGVPHVFGMGGLHGAVENYHGSGLFVNVDVTSYYPSIILKYGYLSRACSNPSIYGDIYNKRVQYKAAKNPLQKPYKRVLNSAYGCMKDKYNTLYDPLQANNVCVTGQLLLLDLIEHVEDAGCGMPVNVNTDGVLFKLQQESDFDRLDDVCYEWEQRTHMQLEFDCYCELWQLNVNNYVLIAEDGSYKGKGAYFKDTSLLDNDLPIVKLALTNYMVKHIPVATTINECNDLMMFQKVYSVSNKFVAAGYGLERLTDKTFRVFASTRSSDSVLYSIGANGSIKAFAGCPKHCFIFNDNVNGIPVPYYLDRQYYIDTVNSILANFGGFSNDLF